MRVLGLDPGTATTGYGIIDAVDGRLTMVAYGGIATPAGDPPPRPAPEPPPGAPPPGGAGSGSPWILWRVVIEES